MTAKESKTYWFGYEPSWTATLAKHLPFHPLVRLSINGKGKVSTSLDITVGKWNYYWRWFKTGTLQKGKEYWGN